jgi:uncharacterized membrane protein
MQSGPLPSPEVLAGYKAIRPDLPDVIIQWADNYNRVHTDKIHIESVAIDRESASLGRGQLFSFLLGLAGFGVAAAFAFNGMEAGAIAAAIGGVAPIIIAALGNLRK